MNRAGRIERLEQLCEGTADPIEQMAEALAFNNHAAAIAAINRMNWSQINQVRADIAFELQRRAHA